MGRCDTARWRGRRSRGRGNRRHRRGAISRGGNWCLFGGHSVRRANKRNRGRRLAVDDGDWRCGGAVDVWNCLECLMRDGQVAGGTKVVEGNGRRPFVGGGTARESARRGRGWRSRVAGDGVGRRPSCVNGGGGAGRRTWVLTRLWANCGADMMGRGRQGVQ